MTHPSWNNYLGGLDGLGYVDPERSPWYMPVQPAIVLRKMQELDRQNRAINAVMQAQTGPIADALGTPFVAQWASYYGEWRLFFSEHEGWLSRWSSDTVEVLEDFISRSNTLEERLRDVNIAVDTLTREEVERQLQDQAPSLPTWAWVLIGLGAVGVGGYLLYTISRVMREGRLIADARSGAVAGFGGPTRVSDLDGPSTYNLEIDR